MSAITIVPRHERLPRSERAMLATLPRFSSGAQCGRRELPRPGAASAQTRLRIQPTWAQSRLIWQSGKCCWADRAYAIARWFARSLQWFKQSSAKT